jgi:hypothetical protein
MSTEYNDMEAYSTTDLAVAAAIKASLHVLPEIRVRGRLCEFVFPLDTAKAQEVVQAFYDDRLTLPVRRFTQDLRDLRALVADAKEARG